MINEIVKEYIGKKEIDNDCAIYIKEILDRIGIKINIDTKKIKDKKSRMVLSELDKYGKRTNEIMANNILAIITDEDTVHIGLFIDKYGRFFHIHNGVGIISIIGSSFNREYYIYNFGGCR